MKDILRICSVLVWPPLLPTDCGKKQIQVLTGQFCIWPPWKQKVWVQSYGPHVKASWFLDPPA